MFGLRQTPCCEVFGERLRSEITSSVQSIVGTHKRMIDRDWMTRVGSPVSSALARCVASTHVKQKESERDGAKRSTGDAPHKEGKMI